MAFDLTVYRLTDRAIIRSGPSGEYARWEASYDRALLFRAPIGSGAAVHQYWSEPAATLGLTALAGLYRDESLEVSGEELDGLRQETIRLVAHWIETITDDAFTTWQLSSRTVKVPLLADLVTRADGVFAGVRIVQRADGLLTIS